MTNRLFALPALRSAESAHLRPLARQTENVRFGTSSWSFPGWKGWVWKDAINKETLSREGLTAYASHPLLRTVSIDHTYYRVPEEGRLAALAQQVPSDFRFVVKVPMSGVSAHIEGRKNARALDGHYFEDILVPRFRELGDRLGGVLMQIPPQRPDGFEGRFLQRLEAILALDLPWTVEVRTPAWLNSDLSSVLQNTGASATLSVHPRLPDLRTQWTTLGIPRQSGPLFIRWNLGHGQDYTKAKERYAPFDRLQNPDLDTRRALAKAIVWAGRRGREVFVIANNKAEGCAPATLIALAQAVTEETP